MRILILFICCIVSASCFSQTITDSLETGFKTPPGAAKPRVWWHWVNGNVTKEGITADLEWMKRVGIGGAQIFDVSLGIPRVVDTPAAFMTPAWKAAMRHAGVEADRLGLELAMQTSGGWSESGSPWVKPEDGMKTIVWSDTVLNGGRHFIGTLSKPGKLFQLKDNPFYVDIKLLAVPMATNADIAPVLDIQDKAQYLVSRPDAQHAIGPSVLPGKSVSAEDVIDISSHLKTDGELDWEMPRGIYKIIRLGYTLTGAESRFSTKESKGLEVDKLSATHVNDYIHQYIDSIAKALGPSFGKSFQYMLMDSWEAGHENWTEDMIAEFQKRRGYDPARWLPVLAGYVFDGADQSDRFLWDFRRTLADLIAEAHYGTITKQAQARGLHGILLKPSELSNQQQETGSRLKARLRFPWENLYWSPGSFPVGGKQTGPI